MKKVLFSLLTIVSLVAGVTLTNAAQNTNDKFTVRFRENTLVVASTQMEEARIYSMQGNLQRALMHAFFLSACPSIERDGDGEEYEVRQPCRHERGHDIIDRESGADGGEKDIRCG